MFWRAPAFRLLQAKRPVFAGMPRPHPTWDVCLQVLLSQVHRLRALVLLGRFLDMGSWAVDLALSVGIFPYVLKLLQTTSAELRATLVSCGADQGGWGRGRPCVRC